MARVTDAAETAALVEWEGIAAEAELAVLRTVAAAWAASQAGLAGTVGLGVVEGALARVDRRHRDDPRESAGVS